MITNAQTYHHGMLLVPSNRALPATAGLDRKRIGKGVRTILGRRRVQFDGGRVK